jgi:hypothetical protein
MFSHQRSIPVESLDVFHVQGSFCSGDGQVQSCPTGLTSDVGAKSSDDCYQAGAWTVTVFDAAAYKEMFKLNQPYRMPDLLNLPVIRRAYFKTVNLPDPVRLPGSGDTRTNFVGSMSGSFIIKTAAVYQMCAGSGGGSQLHIDGVRVSSDPTDHALRSTCVPVYLSSGVHTALYIWYQSDTSPGNNGLAFRGVEGYSYHGPDNANEANKRLQCAGNPKQNDELLSQNCRVTWPSDLQPTPRQQQCKTLAETYCIVACVSWGSAKGRVSVLEIVFVPPSFTFRNCSVCKDYTNSLVYVKPSCLNPKFFGARADKSPPVLSQSDLQSIWAGPDPTLGTDCGCEIAVGMGQFGCCPSYSILADAPQLDTPRSEQCGRLSDLAGKWHMPNIGSFKCTINSFGLGYRTDIQPNRVFRISYTPSLNPNACSFTFLWNDQQPWIVQLSPDKNTIGLLTRDRS